MVTHAIVLGPEFDTVTDDTEDSLMGSAGHQDTIHVIYDGVRLCAVRRDEPWFVGNQLFLLILQEGRNLPRRIAPDIMVYRSLAVALYGPPVLVIEVASPATALGNDVNLRDQNAKPQLYERIGVDEYLVFDPVGEMLGERIWARRRGPNGFVLWEPEGSTHGSGSGRWHSALGISFAPQGMLLRVYDHEGRLVPLSMEFDAMLTARERELAEKDRRLAELEAELRRLRGE